MTQEEKFEEAKRLYETANADQRYVLESLFPELKESEDERIRKELISFVRGVLACHDKPNAERDEKYESWIAWLEKQTLADKVEPIVVRDFNSVFSREQVEEIDKRIEESQRLYNAKLRDAMRKVEDFPMTD